MAQDDAQVRRTVAGFTGLLAAVTELVREKSSKPTLLDAYDDACEQIIGELRGSGLPDEQLQGMHKALARLRLAFEATRA